MYAIQLYRENTLTIIKLNSLCMLLYQVTPSHNHQIILEYPFILNHNCCFTECLWIYIKKQRIQFHKLCPLLFLVSPVHRMGCNRQGGPPPLQSPPLVRSRSCSKSPPPNLRPNAVALSSTPTSVGADYTATSDSEAHGRERSPNPRTDSNSVVADTAGHVPAPRWNRDRSSRLNSDSDSDAEATIGGGSVSSPRRTRDRSPQLHSDFDPDNSVASEDVGEGNTSPLPRVCRSTRIETSSIKPVSSVVFLCRVHLKKLP
jgi:hypothetical protein